MSDYKVEMINDGMHEFYVHFHGPAESKSPLPLFKRVFVELLIFLEINLGDAKLRK